MSNGCISIERVLERLDAYLHANDYSAAERHLKYWLDEARSVYDTRAELFMLNELMGLYRKTGRRDEALDCASIALAIVDSDGIVGSVTAATTYINVATVYKAFELSDKAIHLFEQAKDIYERSLDKGDARLGGLYNNMGLALTDLARFDEAESFYRKAIGVMESVDNGAGEVAITYLNLATMTEKKRGLVDGDEQIRAYLDIAESLLESHTRRDGYYAFVCEKCASVFGYYGRFVYEKTLYDRSRDIYEKERCGGISK